MECGRFRSLVECEVGVWEISQSGRAGIWIQSVEISLSGRQPVPDMNGAMKLNKLSPKRVQISELSKASRLRVGWCVMFDVFELICSVVKPLAKTTTDLYNCRP